MVAYGYVLITQQPLTSNLHVSNIRCPLLRNFQKNNAVIYFFFFLKESTGFFVKKMSTFFIFIKHILYKTTCFKDKNILRKTVVFLSKE